MAHRKVTTTRQETHLEYSCDRCGERADGYRTCCKCKRELCNKCGMWDPEETGDYPATYCKPCWGMGATYRELRDELEAHDEIAEERWKQACIDARKVEEAGIKNVACPKCESENCERFSDAPPDGVNMICKDCGELFKVEE